MNRSIKVIQFTSVCILISSVFLLTGCIKKETGAALTTVSAVVVALPILPFAKVYHSLNKSEVKPNEQTKIWKATLDPVYKEKIELIKKRTASLDAEHSYQSSGIAFMPKYFGGGIYPGLIYDTAKSDYKNNANTIHTDTFLKTIHQLLNKDPVHREVPISDYNRNKSAMYRCFTVIGEKYKILFNKRMSELSERYSYSKELNISALNRDC